MTAPIGDADRAKAAELRQALEEAILAQLRESNPLYYEDATDDLADALLPVVLADREQYAQQRAAEELRAAAATYDEAWPGIDPVTVDLRNRADELDAAREQQP